MQDLIMGNGNQNKLQAEIEGLTLKQKRVLELVVSGLRNAQIGAIMGIGEKTVKMHVTNIFKATGAKNRVQLAMLVLSNGKGAKHG